MELKPEDRYESVPALAEDIEHWLADAPVSVWREPLPGRARRWARRNRTVATGAAAAALAGVIGILTVLAVQTRAYTQLKHANLGLKLANDEVKSARDRARNTSSWRFGPLNIFIFRSVEISTCKTAPSCNRCAAICSRHRLSFTTS